MSLDRSELRTIRGAREELLEEAAALHDSHTLRGDWGDEASAKADYERCIRLAEGLRLIAVKYRPRKP